MSNQSREKQKTEQKAQDVSEEDEALLHFSKYSEARAALPWNQRTFKEKFSHYIDRIFLLFLAVFLMVIAGDIIYKIWYLTNWQKLQKFVMDTIYYLITEEKEEL